jgi:hypothetical protein
MIKRNTIFRHLGHSLLLNAIFNSLLIGSVLAQPQAPLPNQSQDKSLGTVNCTTSTCHGSITPWQGGHILQNEYTTWSRLDPHARAYQTLLSAQSKKIAEKLGLKQGAHNAKICLDCHAHNIPVKQRGERFDITDGVSCEACHGPAQPWIQSHTVENNSHANNLNKGLYPTASPSAQARLCLSCHQGSESKPMTHRIMGAGHPRIAIEIDTFSGILPAHWRIDDDYHQRKGTPDTIKLWALGQGIAVEELLIHLMDPKRGHDGLFPELVLFDCHACHHPMNKEQYSTRSGVGPGRIRLNDSNLLMMRALVKVIDPKSAETFHEKIRALQLAISEGQGDAMTQARLLLETVQQYNQRFEQRHFSNQDLQGVLKAVVDEAAQGLYSDYAGAEQAYMAITSLAMGLSKRGALVNAKEVNRHLALLRKLLANDDKYQADAFQKQLSLLRNAAFVQGK